MMSEALAEPIVAPPFDDLSPLPRRRLAAMRAATRELFDVLEIFAQEGRHPVRDLLAGSPGPFTRWSHYPSTGVEDTGTGSCWFYHAHDPSETRGNEHGHFHCSMYTERLPKGATALALPRERDAKRGGLVHLAALSIDGNGVPTHLFATNRWVTGEWMYPAEEVVPLIEQFGVAPEQRCELTGRWLAALLRLFQPQIVWLLRERDRVLGECRATDPGGFAEDRTIEIASVVSIDVDAQIAALDRAWKRKRPPQRPSERATRKPRTSAAEIATALTRRATRTWNTVLRQDPPRVTRRAQSPSAIQADPSAGALT